MQGSSQEITDVSLIKKAKTSPECIRPLIDDSLILPHAVLHLGQRVSSISEILDQVGSHQVFSLYQVSPLYHNYYMFDEVSFGWK